MKKTMEKILMIVSAIVIMVLAIVIIVILCFECNNVEKENNQELYYQDIADNRNDVLFYNTPNLTDNILENRNGKIIIEKCIGKVINDNLDGEIINYFNKKYNYISYKNTDDIKKGDIVLSYFIYNPDSNYTDDIIERFDYIIDKSNRG